VQAVEITRTLGSSYQLDARLDTLASAHLRRGRIDAALAALREAFLCPNWGGWDVACEVATMAAVLIGRGQPGRGVRLAGAIERHCERLGLDASTAWAINRGWLERGLAVLGHQAAAVRASGRRLSLQEAKAYALTEVSGDEPGVALRLSRREIQVAGLVREGLSNRTIAERLVISERTVEGHVSSLLNKVRVQTRAQVPAWVVEGATEGLLTVLFTDIVGSTELTARRGDDEARATRDLHDRLVREQLAIYGGREVQTTGDGFLVTFNSVRKAIACACAIQGAQLVHNQRFPDRALSVRLGLHTGEVSRRDDGLFGSAVNLAARVMSKAGPGDVLVSDVAKRMAGKVVDVEFRDRGRFQLRGFPARHRLYEVVSSSERALHTDVQPLQTPRPGDQAHA
jgi:class 3 adenylate cyclase